MEIANVLTAGLVAIVSVAGFNYQVKAQHNGYVNLNGSRIPVTFDTCQSPAVFNQARARCGKIGVRSADFVRFGPDSNYDVFYVGPQGVLYADPNYQSYFQPHHPNFGRGYYNGAYCPNGFYVGSAAKGTNSNLTLNLPIGRRGSVTFGSNGFQTASIGVGGPLTLGCR